MSSPRQLTLIAIVLLTGVGSRLALAIGYEGNYDQQSYEIVSDIMRRGGNVYTETSRYNYSPLWAHVLWGLDAVRAGTGLPAHVVIRAALSAIDVAVAGVIALTAGTLRAGAGTAAFAAYLLNPVAVLVVGYHGQFEILAALPLLVATWSTHADRRGGRAIVWALGTLSLLVKHLLVFSVWMLFSYVYSRGGRLVASAAAGLVFVTSFAAYWVDGSEGIMRNVLGHGGLPGLYGFGSFLPRAVSLPLFAAVMVALPLLARVRLHLPLPQAMRLAAIALIVTIDGIGEQYFLIPIVFGSFDRGVGYWMYTAAASAFLLASPNNVAILPFVVPWNVVWVAALGWLALVTLRPLLRSSPSFP